MSQKFDIPQDLYERAEAAAKLGKVAVRRFLLDAILEAVEDVEDSLAADRALAEIAAGEDSILTSEEFWSGLGLDDQLPEVGSKIRRKA